MALLDDLQKLGYGQTLGEGIGTIFDVIQQKRVEQALRPKVQDIVEEFTGAQADPQEAISPQNLFEALNRLEVEALQYGQRGAKELAPARELADLILQRQAGLGGLEMQQEQIRGLTTQNMILEETGLRDAVASIDYKIAHAKSLNTQEDRIRLQGKIQTDLLRVDAAFRLYMQQNEHLFQTRNMERRVSLMMHDALQMNPRTQKLLQFIPESINIAERFFKPGSANVRGLADQITRNQLDEGYSQEEFDEKYAENAAALFQALSPAMGELSTELRQELYDLFIKERTKYDTGAVLGEPPVWMKDFRSFLDHFYLQDDPSDTDNIRDRIRKMTEGDEKPKWFEKRKQQVTPQIMTEEELRNIRAPIKSPTARERQMGGVEESISTGVGTSLQGTRGVSTQAIQRYTSEYEKLREAFERGGLSMTEMMRMLQLEELLGERLE